MGCDDKTPWERPGYVASCQLGLLAVFSSAEITETKDYGSKEEQENR